MKGLLQLCEKYYNTKNLYVVLNIEKNASSEQIRKAFYKLSLLVHPDRVTEEEKEVATEKFKILGLVHSILNDEEKRKVYDQTGTLDDEDDEAIFKSDIDWNLYWKSLYKEVTEEDIANYETQYIGSDEEINDIRRAYVQNEGDMDKIFESVPFSHPKEEERYRKIIEDLIEKEVVPSYDIFVNEPQSKKNRRKRKYEKEEKLYEKVKAKRDKEEEKKKKASTNGSDSMDLVAMIQKNKQNRENSFNRLIANLENKYSEKGKEKKGGTRKSGRNSK